MKIGGTTLLSGEPDSFGIETGWFMGRRYLLD